MCLKFPVTYHRITARRKMPKIIGLDALLHITLFKKLCHFHFLEKHVVLLHLLKCLFYSFFFLHSCDWLGCHATGHMSQINGPVQPHLLKEYRKTLHPPPFLFAFKAIHSSVSTYNYKGSDAEPITLALRVKIDRLF